MSTIGTKPRILVTGAGGQLGQTLRQILAERFTVLPYSRQMMDITEKEQVDSILDKDQPSTVCNTAAFARVDECESHPRRADAVNHAGVKILAEACRKRGTRLVHYSTDYVFDGTKEEPYTEDDSPNPINVYGQSKLDGERAFLDSGVSGSILRVAWLYSDLPGNFVTRLLDSILPKPGSDVDSKGPLRMVDDQIGTFTWCADVAGQTALVIENRLDGLYHATAGGEITRYSFVKALIDMLGIDISVEACSSADFPTPARRPSYSVLENMALKRAGLDVMPSVLEALKQFVEQIKAKIL